MKLNKIIVHNFITYKDQTFDFNKMFEKDNTILIYGVNKDDSTFANDNGAGKSLICEIVLYLLFGRTSRNTSKNLLVGKFDKFAKIKGILEDDYGNKYIITRFIKHPVHVNGVKFSINGDKKTKGTATELSNLIERSLGISYRRIMNTSVFEGNDNRSRFVYLGDKDAKALLLQMKGLDIFSTCYTMANEDYKGAVKSGEKIKERLLKVNWKIEEQKKKIKEYKKVSVGYESRRRKKIKELENSIENLKNKFNKIKAKFLKESKELRKKIKALSSEAPNQNLISKGALSIEKMNSEILVMNEKIFAFRQDINKYNQQIKDLSSQGIGEKCDKCGSLIEKKNVKGYLKEISAELDYTEIKHENLNKALEKLLTAYDKIETKTNKSKNKLTDINVEITKLKDKLKWKAASIDEKASGFRTSMRYEEIELDTLINKKNEFKELLAKERKRKSKASLNKKLIEQKIASQEETERYYKAWVDGFGQEAIQNYALKSVVEELNDQILKISEILTDGLVDIKVLTEKVLGNKKVKNIFELKITDLIKKKLPFKEWSKGQKKRIEIITNFALMNLEDNVLREIFLDEMFDGVDRTGISKILSLLNNEDNKGKRFIVFSHSEDIKQRFTNYGCVTLKNGCSTFEMGG